ncbi:hypothetical protein POVWA1_088700 [Plasmodium ovale wallikeri]|uniref:Uncharacterized protein n=1 Tax=Plasmodium ovale wallikeri TaxID=864142 RepID=A0A1A9AQX0_PLAOA|nr:hypothetical protein POVWA1_088700 [Plasmodium ovale wallikeri]
MIGKLPDFLNFKEFFNKIQTLKKLLCIQFQIDRTSFEIQDKTGKAENSADPGYGHSGSSLLNDMTYYVLKKIKIGRYIDYEDAQEFLSDNSLSIYSGITPPHMTCHPQRD